MIPTIRPTIGISIFKISFIETEISIPLFKLRSGGYFLLNLTAVPYAKSSAEPAITDDVV